MSTTTPSLARNVRHAMFNFSRKHFGWPPIPPTHEAKCNFVMRKAAERHLEIFIETGTFRGEMLAFQLPHFKKLISIELSQELHRAACARFTAFPKVQVIQGDSGVKLGEAIKGLAAPALFWLDAHYSIGLTAGRGTSAPIFKELSCLTNRQQYPDAILIDDARLFGWDFGYPSLKAIRNFVSEHWPSHTCVVESDIICILPPLER